tara:strand:- start:1607 stop:1927 length:321 start_codon:yes stop_codon:yes gene_type:complete
MLVAINIWLYIFGEYNEGVPTFAEHIEFMDKIGFTTFDMIEIHIEFGFARQVDMLFINTTSEFYTEFTRIKFRFQSNRLWGKGLSYRLYKTVHRYRGECCPCNYAN